MSLQGLQRLEVWQRAKDFALHVYRGVLPLLPSKEKWNLGSQLRRSSLSISANIAEGYGRFYYQENVRFCYNARGSLEETLSLLLFAFEANFIPEALFKEISSEGHEVFACSMVTLPTLNVVNKEPTNPAPLTPYKNCPSPIKLKLWKRIELFSALGYLISRSNP
jgi:four helix bundle protein